LQSAPTILQTDHNSLRKISVDTHLNPRCWKFFFGSGITPFGVRAEPEQIPHFFCGIVRVTPNVNAEGP